MVKFNPQATTAVSEGPAVVHGTRRVGCFTASGFRAVRAVISNGEFHDRSSRLNPLRVAAAMVATGPASGAVAFALASMPGASHPLSAAWHAAALGFCLGSPLGVGLAPLAFAVSLPSAEPARAWFQRHGRGFAAAAFALPMIVGATSLISLVVVSEAFRRLHVPEVASLVSVLVVLSTSLLVTAGFASLAALWASRARPRSGLLGIFVVPWLGGLIATVAATFAVDLVFSLAPHGVVAWTPLDVVHEAARSIDVAGFVGLWATLALIFPTSLLALRRPAATAILLLLATVPFVAAARATSPSVVALAPGPRQYALRAARGVMDRDHDGHATWFGGHDCDDRDPAVYPGALEIPGNHRDEDCSGDDLDLGALRALDTPDPLTPAVRARLEDVVPASPNIVLLTVDSLRADLHRAGNPLRVSPNLDRLAQRSVVFTRAYAPSTYTARSLGATMTGRHADELLRTRETMHRYSNANVFLAERLRDVGITSWNSVVISSAVTFRPQTGLTQGFAVAHPDLIPARFSPRETSDDRVASRAIEAVQWPRASDDRFFVWAHFLDPHEEYMPHPEFGDFGPPPMGRYWQEVAWTDRQVGRVIDAVDALPEERRRRTIVIVSADHGESFDEHGTAYHGRDLWEQEVHVPLMFYIPGATPRTIETPRSLIDLAPTILDLMRVARPERAAADGLSGVTLVPEMLGFEQAPRPVYADLPAEAFARVPVYMLIDGRWKIRVYGGEAPRLFDLAADPLERVDLAARRPIELHRMRSLLGAMRARMRRRAPVETPPPGW